MTRDRHMTIAAAAIVMSLGAALLGAAIAEPAAADDPAVETDSAATMDAAVPSDASPFVNIEIRVRPRVKARVYWGKEQLGTAPLTLKRPRNSGPMDVVVKAWRHVPLNTRLYTFEDEDVVLKLTPVSQKHTLYGHKVALPEPDAGPPDASAPVPTPEGAATP